MAAMNGRLPAFLIVGTPRSGTTLVQRLAAEIPGVAIPPETHFFALFVRPLLAHVDFPLQGKDLERALECFTRLKTSEGLTIDVEGIAATLGVCRSPLELFGAIVTHLAGGASVYGEKTPNHLLWWRPLAEAAPHLRFIGVVRDPRAVVASYRTTWGTEPHLVTAQRWLADQRQMTQMARALPDRALVLRYEDVVSDPTGVRSQIARFVGLPEPSTNGRRHPPAAESLFLPWERWKEAALQPIVTDRVDGWRGVLSEDESAKVAAICARQMRLWGYDGAPRGATPVMDEGRARLRFMRRRWAKMKAMKRIKLD